MSMFKEKFDELKKLIGAKEAESLVAQAEALLRRQAPGRGWVLQHANSPGGARMRLQILHRATPIFVRFTRIPMVLPLMEAPAARD